MAQDGIWGKACLGYYKEGRKTYLESDGGEGKVICSGMGKEDMSGMCLGGGACVG
jgi:hypothetical protein